MPLGTEVGALEGAGAGAPGNGNGSAVGSDVGIVKIGPPPEFEGRGNGFGSPGNSDGKGKGDAGSAPDGVALDGPEGWGFGPGAGPEAGGIGRGTGVAGRSGATVAVETGRGASGGAVMLATLTGVLVGGGEAVDGEGCGEGPLLEPLKAKATTMPAPSSTGSAMSSQTEDPCRRERGT